VESDPYRRVGKRELYRNPWLAVEAHEIVHPNGRAGEHVLVVTPQACAVVVEDAGALLFAKQPRFGARRWVIELVKGGREAGESGAACAARELREELGIEARTWTALGRLYEIPSIVSDAVEVFVASDTVRLPPEPEEVESIETVRMTFDEAIAGVASGAIDDAVTAAALLRYGLVRGLIAAATPARSTTTPARRVRD
jgi:8-oxo-dGTP pyrophosphatase MutT (NUDIX family)